MFENALNLDADSIAALRDPAAAIYRALAELPKQIATTQKTIQDLQQKATTLSTPKQGWFGPKPVGLMDELRSGYAEVQQKMEEENLVQFQQTYKFICNPLYPPNTTWTFDKVEREILRLYTQLSNAYASLASSATISPFASVQKDLTSADPTKAKIQIDWGKLLSDAMTRASIENIDHMRLVVCKLIVELEELCEERVLLLPSYLSTVSTWDKHKIEIELLKRNRDLSALPEEVKTYNATMSSMSALIAVLLDQRTFLEDIILELEAALKKVSATSPGPVPDPAAAKIARLADIRKKWEASKKNNPQVLWPDIDRVYGKMMDDERKK